ncbi:hypothetical protein CYMTET_52456, partial [Cymbomonas tetramitiformis]
SVTFHVDKADPRVVNARSMHLLSNATGSGLVADLGAHPPGSHIITAYYTGSATQHVALHAVLSHPVDGSRMSSRSDR